MKQLSVLHLLTTILFANLLASCVQNDDFNIPITIGNEENAGLNALLESATEVSIADAKALYTGEQNITEIKNTIYIKGYVSSSDRFGNFFKEFFIQDQPENPTSAIKISIDRTDTYNQFNFGREVYINLKGLYIGEERVGNDIITIGGGTQTNAFGTTVTKINDIQAKTNIFRSKNTVELTPLPVTLTSIKNKHIGTYIQVNNVEFEDNLKGKRYFDPSQQFDTKRRLQSCQGFDYTKFYLETSAFANFKEQLLPLGNGTIKAVVNKTFDGATLVLSLNTTDAVLMEAERCHLLNIENYTTLFEEHFNTATNNTSLDIDNWTNSAEAGTRVWREKVENNNGYTELSAFSSNDSKNIAWLISPPINMDTQNNEILMFKSAQHHVDSNANRLEVFVSTNFDGTKISAASWESIDANIPNKNSAWYTFISSGSIDLSNYSGTLYIAFKYTGSGTDTALDGAYQIDDFVILAN